MAKAPIDGHRLGDSSTRLGGAGRCYLLFAGSQQARRGGLGDLVEAFSSDEMARKAFRQIRLSESSSMAWAQLVVVDHEFGVKPLCWFGVGAKPDTNRSVPIGTGHDDSSGSPPRMRRRWPKRYRGGGVQRRAFTTRSRGRWV